MNGIGQVMYGSNIIKAFKNLIGQKKKNFVYLEQEKKD